MSFIKFLLFYSLAAFSLFAQQSSVSIHKLHNQQFGIENKIPGRFAKDGNDIISINENKLASKDLSAAVFGYLPDWEYANGNYQYLQYDLLTHLACFDFAVAANGDISTPAYWPWTDLINKAHSNGVKVILTAVNFDSDDIREIVTNEDSKNNFFENARDLMQTYNFDGINIDFEGLSNNIKEGPINEFMSDLKTYLTNEIGETEVSFAGPAVNWDNRWDLVGLAESCDYIFIMGYAFSWSGSATTGPNAPLTGGTYNILNTVEVQYSQVTESYPEKLILGVPYYGHHWTAESQHPGADTIDFINSTRYRDAQELSQVHGLLWDEESQTPWMRWNEENWHQIWYDNDSSLALKYEFANDKGYKGVGMWALGYDGERQELWNLIDLIYGSGELPPPPSPRFFRVTGKNDSTLKINYGFSERATGFKIIQSYDGVNFIDTIEVQSNDIEITGLNGDSTYFYKVKAFNENGESAETEVLSAKPSDDKDVLIVNGFDRISGTNNTFDYIRKYAEPLSNKQKMFSSTSNEAVYTGKISLQDYETVIWMLGDESTSGETFNLFEQDSVKSYLRNGGKLFVTGAEIGWDLGRAGSSSDSDISFYHNFLKADYISDAPNGNNSTYYSAEPVNGSLLEDVPVFSFDDGTHGTFDVDWPDAIDPINGSESVLKFENVSTVDGAAGVSFEGVFPGGNKTGKLVYLTIPFETIYPQSKRIQLMSKVYDLFDAETSVAEKVEIPKSFKLYQNYPNPFNPSTTIKYEVAEEVRVLIQVYDALGREVETLVDQVKQPGVYEAEFPGSSLNSNLASGFYVYQIKAGEFVKSKKMMLLK